MHSYIIMAIQNNNYNSDSNLNESCDTRKIIIYQITCSNRLLGQQVYDIY